MNARAGIGKVEGTTHLPQGLKGRRTIGRQFTAWHEGKVHAEGLGKLCRLELTEPVVTEYKREAFLLVHQRLSGVLHRRRNAHAVSIAKQRHQHIGRGGSNGGRDGLGYERHGRGADSGKLRGVHYAYRDGRHRHYECELLPTVHQAVEPT